MTCLLCEHSMSPDRDDNLGVHWFWVTDAEPVLLHEECVALLIRRELAHKHAVKPLGSRNALTAQREA